MRFSWAIVLFIALSPHISFAETLTVEEANAECASYPNIPVNVTPRFDEPVYNFSVSLAELQALSSDIKHNVHEGHHGLTLGLTRYEPILEISVPIRAVEVDGGLACAHVEHVDVSIGYRNVTVFVPKEVPQGSCGFDQVMIHEQKHIEVNRQILREFAPLIEQKLGAYLKVNGVFREQNLEYATSLLKDHLQKIINEVGGQIATENARRQQLVDSPEEYRRVSATCNGQLVQAATQYMRTGK